jgi:hypothetical protein
MSAFRAALVILVMLSTGAVAAPPSDESIRQLLDITHVKTMLDGVQAQVSAMVDKLIDQQLHGATPSPEQQRANDNMKRKMADLFRRTLSWEKFEPMNTQMYKESFNQEEIDGMLAFYRTPAGQAVINKMPVLLQKMMVQVQANQQQMAPQIQQIVREYCSDLKISCQ